MAARTSSSHLALEENQYVFHLSLQGLSLFESQLIWLSSNFSSNFDVLKIILQFTPVFLFRLWGCSEFPISQNKITSLLDFSNICNPRKNIGGRELYCSGRHPCENWYPILFSFFTIEIWDKYKCREQSRISNNYEFISSLALYPSPPPIQTLSCHL